VDLKGDAPRQSQSLRRVLELVERLLGSDEDYHPLSVESMTIDTGRETRAIEAGAVVERSSGLRFVLRMIRIRIEMFVVSVALALHLPLRRGRKRLDRIKEDNYINSDFRKFDGTLKMIVATTSAQRQVLERLLSDLRRQGVINYGLHVSDRALMTCLVHFGSGSEVHFVDAADGGYAIAARQIKQQIAEDGR
jgi:hypothetical protein